MASQEELVEKGRKAIDTVTERVKDDNEYAERFKKEPVEVLLEAGAPEEGLADVLRETGFDEDDVSGFLFQISPTTTSPTSLQKPGISSPTRLSPGGTGGLAECSGTCNCSSSCLFTF